MLPIRHKKIWRATGGREATQKTEQTLTFVPAQVTKNRNHGKIVASEKEKTMRVSLERQDASDGTGITCLNNSLNTRHVG